MNFPYYNFFLALVWLVLALALLWMRILRDQGVGEFELWGRDSLIVGFALLLSCYNLIRGIIRLKLNRRALASRDDDPDDSPPPKVTDPEFDFYRAGPPPPPRDN